MENKNHVKLEFDLNKVNFDKLRKIEILLGEIGISFDTGWTAEDNIRDWELDWSLQGPVKVVIK